MDTTLERPKMTPKDFFTYLGVAVTLYVSAGSLLALLFAVINATFIDALQGPYAAMNAAGTLQFSIASLLVVFPLYILLSWRARADVIRDPAKAGLAIRRWFVWLTLFIAGATVAGDLIALLNTYFGGEVTLRFILKMLAVFAVAGAVFGYYAYDLKRGVSGVTTPNKSLAGIASLAVLAAIVTGFIVIGSPAERRAVRFDEQRASDLSSIQWEVLNYWQTKYVLPASLADLEDAFSGYRAPTDPETGDAYDYSVTGTLSFELCATFNRSNKEVLGASGTSYPRDPWGFETLFEHDEGRTCFERTIDPQKYRPIP